MSQESLRVALSLTEQVIGLTKGNQWEKYLHGELLTVKYELQRQIGLVDADAPPSDVPEATPPTPVKQHTHHTPADMTEVIQRSDRHLSTRV